MKKVKIFMKVVQSLNSQIKNGLGDNFELFTRGTLKKSKNKWIVEYDNEYNGKSKISLFEDGRVEIITNGDICYTLKLDKNKVTNFSCNTKDTFSFFSVVTYVVFFKIDENGGVIDLEYGLEIDEFGSILKNKMEIEIK